MTENPDRPSFEPPATGPGGSYVPPLQGYGPPGTQPTSQPAAGYGSQPATPYDSGLGGGHVGAPSPSQNGQQASQGYGQGSPQRSYGPSETGAWPTAQPPTQAAYGQSGPQPYGQGPQAYGPGSAYPEPGSQPYGSQPNGGYAGGPQRPADWQPPEQPATPALPENVGKGLGYAALGILAGSVVSAAIYHFGFLASIVAFAMSAAMVWLYAKGAGAPVRKGAMPLIALIVAGLVFAWIFTLASELFFVATKQGAGAGEAIGFALSHITDSRLYSLTVKDALFFFGFGALGMFSTIRQLMAAGKSAG